MKNCFRLGLIFSLCLFSSCGSSNTTNGEPAGSIDSIANYPPPESFQLVVPMHWAGHKSEFEWNRDLRWALFHYGKELLTTQPRDIHLYAAGYSTFNQNERLSFWAHLISLMAKKESNFDPSTKYVEKFTDGSGKKVISRGLLQISLRSSNSYNCQIKNEMDLHLVKKNLACGVRILSKWVKEDKVISKNNGGWKGGARYWAVLRNSKNHQYIKSHSLSVF